MKTTWLVAFTLCCTLSSPGENWYESLRPGVTRGEIVKIAGRPTSSAGATDTYKQGHGNIVCKYQDDVLRSLVHYNTPDGAVADTTYSAEGELTESDIAARATYLANQDFAVVPTLSGRRVYTRKYAGTCYEVDGNFIVIEPIIRLMAGQGYFADKAARVLRVDRQGIETVLYVAAEHWDQLRPPGVSEEQVRSRSAKLTEAQQSVKGRELAEVFGKSDSSMGSGIDHRLYYLDNALAVVTCSHSNNSVLVANVVIVKPGVTNLTLKRWLASPRSAGSPNAAPAHR
jgi:hypothetical protein